MPDGNDPTPETFDFRGLVADDGNFVDNWHDQLPEDARKDIGDNEHLKNIKTPVQLATEVVGLSRFKGRALVPKADAADEDWDKVFEASGKPGDDEGYGFSLEKVEDEGLRTRLEASGYADRLERIMKRAGIPTRIAAKVANASLAEAADDYQAGRQARKELRDKMVTALGGEKQYGKAEIAGRDALARLYGEDKDAHAEVLTALTAAEMVDHPALVSLLNRINERLTPGTVVTGGQKIQTQPQSENEQSFPNTMADLKRARGL